MPTDKFRNILRAIVLTTCVVIIIIASAKMINSPYAKGDFEAFLHAANSIAAGEDIYANPSRPVADGGLYYLYLPLLGIILLPLTFLPIEAAIIVWTAANTFLAYWTVTTFYRLISRSASRDQNQTNGTVVTLVSVILTSRYLLHHLYYGQANILVMAGLVWALWLINKDQRAIGGTIAGITTVIKTVSAPFWIWIAADLRWRELLGMILGVFSGVILIPGLVIGFDTNWSYIQHWTSNILFAADLGTAKVPLGVNVSIQALFHRLFERTPAFVLNGSPIYLTVAELPRWVIFGLERTFEVSLLLSIILYRNIFRRNGSLIGYWGGIALTFAVMPLFAPTAQKHYFVFLLPAYVYVIYLWRESVVKDNWFKAFILISFVLGGAKFDGIFGNLVDGIFFALSLNSFGAIFLALAIIRGAVCDLRNDEVGIFKVGELLPPKMHLRSRPSE